MAAAVANLLPAASEALKTVGIEQGARSATAHRIARMLLEAIRQPAQALEVAARHYSAMVVALDSMAATRPFVMVVAVSVPVATTRQPVAASRVVAVTRDWAVVEVGRLRSCRKSGHYLVDLLRSWRIFAY